MICPYCDSRIGVLPDNRSCPHCGAPLGVVKHRKPQFPEPPLGIYKGVSGYIEIGTCSVSFSKKFPFNDRISCVVPYEDILDVALEPPTVFFAGFLCVRRWQDRQIPLARKWMESANDATSVGFHFDKRKDFLQVYEFLKQCADIANAARELQGESRL